METPSARPIAVALVCSSFLHLAAVLVYVHQWAPWADTSARAGDTTGPISVSLSPTSSPTSVAGEPRSEDDAVKAPGEPLAPSPGPVMPEQPEQIARATVPPAETRALPVDRVDLNPVPRLQEDFSIDMATLAVRAPMEPTQQQDLQSALNHFSTRLPEWTEPGTPLQWQHEEREYQIRVEKRAPASATGLERAVLAVTTEVDGLSLTARVPVKRMAFSHFAQVVDRWNPEVSLAGDQIVGRFHSNSELYVEAGRGASPLVTGLTTVAGRVNFNGGADISEIFASGLETWAQRMPLPSDAFAWEELSPGEGHVHHISRDARIRFRGDGSYDWQPLGAPSVERAVQGRDPWLIIAEDGVELQVEGVVKGSVLVYSPRRVSISGDLRYANDPRDAASPDFLGLVSENYVEVAGPDVTGTGDITIEAAIYAGRQFRVRKYRSAEGGRMNIYGSVTAGSLSATEPRFTTRLTFDRRLEDSRPAYFPQTNRYVMEGAAPEWTVESITAAR